MIRTDWTREQIASAHADNGLKAGRLMDVEVVPAAAREVLRLLGHNLPPLEEAAE